MEVFTSARSLSSPQSVYSAENTPSQLLPRSSSLTNLSRQRRPGIEERNPSSTSLKQLNGPRTPKNGPQKTLARTIYTTSHLRNNNASNTPSVLPNIVTSNLDKQRLVEQFYSAVNENQSKRSSPDFGRVAAHGPASQKTPPAELTAETFEALVADGGLKYVPIDDLVAGDTELTDYLLNIDSVAYTKDPEVRGLELLSRTLNQVSGNLRSISPTQLATTTGDYSLLQLEQLLRYLAHLQTTTQQLFDELHSNRDAVKLKHQQAVSRNVSKLDGLVDSLHALEDRLDKTKARISANKKTMLTEVMAKFEVLEYVDRKFNEHAQITRHRRFKQLNVWLAVVVLAVAIYFGFRKLAPTI